MRPAATLLLGIICAAFVAADEATNKPATIMTVLIGAPRARAAAAAAAAATSSALPLSLLPTASQCRVIRDSACADDLGWGDTQTRNPFSPTPHIGQLAYEGIDLLQHYVYMCERLRSPARPACYAAD